MIIVPISRKKKRGKRLLKTQNSRERSSTLMKNIRGRRSVRRSETNTGSRRKLRAARTSRRCWMRWRRSTEWVMRMLGSCSRKCARLVFLNGTKWHHKISIVYRIRTTGIKPKPKWTRKWRKEQSKKKLKRTLEWINVSSSDRSCWKEQHNIDS